MYDYQNSTVIRFELNKPFYEFSSNAGLISTGNYLNLHFPLSANVGLSAELPFAVRRVNSNTHIGIGNVGIGLELWNTNRSFMFEMGSRAPVRSDNPTMYLGFLMDLPERPDSYIEAIPIRLIANRFFNYIDDTGFTARLRSGFIFMIPTESGDRSELVYNFGLLPGYKFESVRIYWGVAGTILLTERRRTFSERVLTNYFLSVDFGSGSSRPGIIIRLPQNEDVSRIISAFIGLSWTLVY